jgi:hypothetical protein
MKRSGLALLLVCAVGAGGCPASDSPATSDAAAGGADADLPGAADASPTADAADAAPVSGGDCLQGAAADLVRAMYGKVWWLVGFVGRKGDYTPLVDMCMKASSATNHYYAYYSFVIPGRPVAVGGGEDPACTVARNGGKIEGVDGVLQHDVKCQLDGTGSGCHTLLWMMNGQQAGADGSLAFEQYQTLADGTIAKGYSHFSDVFRLENGKLYEGYGVGDYVWRVFEPYGAAICPQGVFSKPPQD